MNGLVSITNDPGINLATEEYLLRHTNHDVFFLYTNSPSIIIGKHQNTLAEINYEYINQRNIPVYRRLSGGGTVYHDLNNLNFCFIQTGKKGELVNFAKYSEPILLALNKLNIKATFGKRHDIQIKKKKISGNASHVYKNRVMHHGTLLFNSDLSILNNSLKTNPLSIKDKAVKSVRSEVTNITDYLTKPLSYTQFKSYIFDFLLNYYNTSSTIQLNKPEISQIEAIFKEKYNTWEWNYGYSPNFELNRSYKINSGARVISLIRVEKGLISECQLKISDKSLKMYFDEICKHVIGIQHNSILIKDELYKLKSIHLSENELNLVIDGFFN